MTIAWDHEFTVDGMNWGVQFLENGRIHLAQVTPEPSVKGETGLLWKAPLASLFLSAEIFTKVAELMERRETEKRWQQEKERAEQIFEELLGQEVKHKSDLRYGPSQTPVTTGLSLELVSERRDCPIEAIRMIAQDYVQKGIFGIDAYNRIVIYRPEHFYEGWAS